MVPGTALSLLLLSLSLGAFLTARGRQQSLLVTLGAAGALAVAFGTLALQQLTGTGLGDDVFASLMEPRDKMAFGTVMGVALAAVALIAGTRSARARELCATLGLLLSSLGIVGYALDTAALYQFFMFTAMALNTALAFTALFLAILLSDPSRNWMKLLLGTGLGSRTARRVLPLALVAPMLLAGAMLWMTDLGHVAPNFRLSLLTVALMAASGVAVLASASVENRAEARLLETIAELERTNADRALLLREVYHRVKNNLQQINAMLRLEARKLDDPRLTASFTAMTERVRALGIVHQMLISAPTPSEVRLPDFLDRLTGALSSSYGLARRGISLELDVEEGTAHLDFAVSLGLVVNELLGNAVKHAFPEESRGTILLRFSKTPEATLLEVSDDGRGAPEDYLEGGGTGALLIRSMVQQLQGDIAVDTGRGTRVTVTMPPDIERHGRYV